MAWNPFSVYTAAELLELRKAAVGDLGTTIVSTGVGDVNATGQMNMSPEQRIELISRALFAIDPVTYPLDNFRRDSFHRKSF